MYSFGLLAAGLFMHHKQAYFFRTCRRTTCKNQRHHQSSEQDCVETERGSRFPTFRLEPRQRMRSACCAASAAPVQFRGCSSVPRSPQCTIVSLSSQPQCGDFRSVPCLCSAGRSVTSNRRITSRAGEHERHTCSE